MGALQPFSKFDGRTVGLAITADKMNRLCLTVGLQKLLGGNSSKYDLYIFFDQEDRRIGISQLCKDKNIVPFTFDNRGYTPAKGFLKMCEIDTRESGKTFYYEGMEGDVYVFSEVGRKKTTLRMERNGNLERA
jgi:hypothetical protein